jgi:regulatory protein
MALNDMPRTARKARPRPSLKMQAIGFLSRREHSRQELREKLLMSLRKRAREEAALAAAGDRAALEVAEALRATPSNGIDDAFSPVMASPVASRQGDVRDRDAAEASRGARAGAVIGSDGVGGDSHDDTQDPEAVVDQLLDWLVANKYLSEQRFVESRVNARARKQGAMMIKHELSRHGLALEPEQAAALRETEFARAQALWQRKFGDVAGDPRARAKQARFLASRGFASDVVRRIVGGEEEF